MPVIPTLMGWGAIPDDHPLMAGMVRPADQPPLRQRDDAGQSDFVLGIGNRWANRHTGSIEVYTKGRTFVHVDIEPTQIGRVFAPDYGIVSDAKAALELFVEVARELKAGGHAAGPRRLGRRLPRAQAHDAAQDPLRRRADQAAARLPGDEQGVRPRHLLRHAPSACRRSPARSSCTSTSRATGSTAARPARSAGPSRPRSACAPPTRRARSSALSGDYDFQFMIEELAVGAQFKLPYIHVRREQLLPRADPPGAARLRHGLLRAARLREHQLPRSVERLRRGPRQGRRRAWAARRSACTEPDEIRPAFAQARSWMQEHRVPVVVEIILERVTNIAMGTEIDKISEFEDLAECRSMRRPPSRLLD